MMRRVKLPRTSPTALALAVMLVLKVGLTGGCATGVDRLPPLDRRFYEVLASDTDRKDFLGTKPAERQSFLESRGLWEAWQSLTAKERAAVESGAIEVGYLQFAAHMAWGRPADVKVVKAGSRTVLYETFIRCTSGPKTGRYVRQNMECDGTSSERRIAVEDGLVTEIRDLD